MTKSSDALPRSLKRLAVLQAAMNGAHFAGMPMLAVLLTASSENSPTAAGTVLAIYFVLSRIGPLIVAPLAERFGLWQAVTIGLCLRGAAFLAFPFVGENGAIVAGSVLGLGQAVHEAGIYGVMGRQEPRWRDKLLVLNGQALNIGCVVGPIVGVGLVLWSPAMSFVIGGAVLIVLGIWSMSARSSLVRMAAFPAEPSSIGEVYKDRHFLLLCIALIPFWAVFAQLFATFPLLASQLGGSAAWANAILIVNGLTGVVALAIVARWIERGQILLVLFVGLTLAFATIAGTAYMPSLSTLLLLVILFSVGESFVMAASDILTARHADGRATALYFGCLNASAGVGAAFGGYVGTMSVDDPHDLTTALAGLGLLSIIPLVAYAAKWMKGREVLS